MRPLSRRMALGFLGAFGLAGGLTAAPLAVGDEAPDFELQSSKGGSEKLSAYRGKKNVVTAFYPKAFTGG